MVAPSSPGGAAEGTRVPGERRESTQARRAAANAVKAFHTAVFLLVSTSILHVFLAGVRGRPSRWTGLALATALAECAVFVLNRGRCPLTKVAEDLGTESGRVTDIFLPLWFADRIPYIYTPPLVVGVVALLARGWRPGRPARR